MSEQERRVLPEGWRWVRLGEVCRVVSGSTPSSSIKEYWDGDVIWITPTDLGSNKSVYIAEGQRRISRQGYTSSGIEMVPAGSVVMSSRAPIGHLAIAGVELCTNQGCKSFVPKSEIESNYLYYALKFSVKAIKDLGSGATFTEVSKSQLEDFAVPLPSLPEQHRIAVVLNEYLSSVEQARRALEARVEVMQALPAALLREVFESEEAQGWERLTVGHMLSEGVLIYHQDGNHGDLHPRNKDFVSAGVRFVTAKHMRRDGTVDINAAPFISEKQASSLRIGLGRPGDIFLAHNATVGPVAIAPNDCEPYIVGTSVTLYRSNEHKLLPLFLFLALNARQFQSQLFDAMKQTTRNQVPITKQRELTLPLPKVEEQQDVVNELSKQLPSIENARLSASKQLTALNAMPAALLRKAFNGEL